jgi:hypothetical protein
MGGPELNVMWKAAAVVIIVTIAGATAHAQQQQSPIENLDKTISELAQEGYEIKAAEDPNLGRGGGDGHGIKP